MSQVLQKDVYKLRLLGISIDSLGVPDSDPLIALRYSCVYWASHFQDLNKSSLFYQRGLSDDGEIHQFLRKYFLYWLEALSLIGKVSESVTAISSLEFFSSESLSNDIVVVLIEYLRLIRNIIYTGF
jgi:hypothetical protein